MTVISEPEAKRSGGNSPSQVREISIAHSPDSDDAFMFYGLATSKVRVPGLRFASLLDPSPLAGMVSRPSIKAWTKTRESFCCAARRSSA